MIANDNPILDKAVKKRPYVSADEKLRYELDMREKAELDYGAAMKSNYIKGKAEGMAEGNKEACLNIVRNMAKMDLSAEVIAGATGLSLDEIHALLALAP
jgi:predicted transposase/invertase (TIGR01784 family)